MTSLLTHLASLAGRRPRLATLAVLLGICGIVAGAVAAGGGFKDDFTVPGIEAQKAQDLLEQRFPAQSGTSATVVFHARDGKLARGDLAAPLAAIGKQPHVVSVEDLRVARDGRTAFAQVDYDKPADDLGAKPRERLKAATAGIAGVDVALAGEVIDGEATGGFPIGEVLGLVLAVVLLIVVLRSLRAAGNALLAAFAGIGLGFGLLLWASTLTDVPGLAPTLAGMLGLGTGIDYALLLAARQQEELRAGHPPVEAARRANATAGHAALTAAGIVLVSIAGLLVTGIPFVGRAGVAAGIVVLRGRPHVRDPAAGPLRTLGAQAPAAARARARRPCARRGARARPFATRRPWLALLAGGAVTAALAAPAVGLELGQPDDRNLSPEATQRQAYDRLAQFGPGVNGPLVVAVAGADAGTLQRLERGCAPTPTSPPWPSRSSTRPATPPSSPSPRAAARRTTAPARSSTACAPTRSRGAARQRRDRLRRRPHRPLPGRGGPHRLADPAVRGHRRRALAAAPARGLPVLEVSLLSALFNLASIVAAYGVVVLAFQTETGSSLLGVEQLPVVPYVPLFMFAILFGLSTDYNVFLLSRVREEWPPPRRPPRSDRGRLGGDAPDHRGRGRDHDRRLPRLRQRPGPGDQDDRRRARERRARRHHARPAVDGACRAHAARRPAVAGRRRQRAAQAALS